jgi:hypothetical protein
VERERNGDGSRSAEDAGSLEARPCRPRRADTRAVSSRTSGAGVVRLRVLLEAARSAIPAHWPVFLAFSAHNLSGG